MEVSGQGTGKILGIDAMMFFTVVTDTIQDGIFVGDETTIITTLDWRERNNEVHSIFWPSRKGEISRGASTQNTKSQSL